MKDYDFVPPNDERKLKEAVAQGPVSIAIEADDERMQFYEKGVFKSKNCGTDVDHAMTIVGYGIDGRNKYWKVIGLKQDSANLKKKKQIRCPPPPFMDDENLKIANYLYFIMISVCSSMKMSA